MLDRELYGVDSNETEQSSLVPVIPVTLKAIGQPVEVELEHFRQYFRDSMRSSVGLLDKITQYILRQKGKRIRPLLVLLSAKICGDITESTYRAAALVELLHTATLVHDDVVDDAERRRGLFSINALWKNKIAVLLGDYFLSRGLLLALNNKDYDILHALSDAVKRMSEGELLQIEKSRLLDIDEDTYYRIISDKTASLISACTVCGALSTTSDPEVIQKLRELGEKLGLAFQIRDDLFDYGLDDVGKPLGIDLKEKKLTLPLIYALRSTDAATRTHMLKIVKKKKKRRADIREVSDFVDRTGGLAYTHEIMENLAGDARRILTYFPATEARAALTGLVNYTVTRKK